MANVGLATLGSLRLQAQQRADMVNSNFVSVQEWNQYLTNSYKELYDLLIASYGDEYSVATPYVFTSTSGTTSGNGQLYPLPDGLTTTDAVTGLVAAPLYKLVGVDLQVTATPTSWMTLDNFTFGERNRYWAGNQYAINGVVTCRYRILGSNLWITPVPAVNQTFQLWYYPKPVNLQACVVCSTTSSSTVVTTSDTSQLAVGMSLAVAAQTGVPVPAGATIVSIVAGVSFTMSAQATGTSSNTLVYAWSDATTLDGISGWEEYVIVDGAIKALGKEESDTGLLMATKAALRDRIKEMSANRDAGAPNHVNDVQSTELWNGGGWGGGW